MYEDLIEKLRNNSSGFVSGDTVREAADAIEKLQKDLERSKDFESFWQYEAEEALRKFQVAIANKPQWIPVTERLPVDTKSVLIVHKGGVSTGWHNGRYWERGASTNHRPIQTVTHWMPLPEPPKEGKGKNFVDVMIDAGLTCKNCYFSKEWCNDESAICEDETGLCERFDPVD